MLEEMEGDLATAKKDEATAATGFEELSAAKASEIASATSAIESKTKRSGEVAVEVVQTKDDLEDTQAEVFSIRTELNYSILRLNFPIISGIFTKISQNFANFLQSSLSLDILEHVREIPTKFHLNFGEK